MLHKLLEEVLTGQTAEDEAALTTLAAVLVTQMLDTPGAGSLDPAEVACAVCRGLAVPAVAAVRDLLVPEYPVVRSVLEDAEEVVSWRGADASRGRPPPGGLPRVVRWPRSPDRWLSLVRR